MDQPKSKSNQPAQKPEGVKLVSFDTQLLPGALQGQLTINFYALGDDDKIYLFSKEHNWVEFR